jgi:hypothetical protein
MFGHISLTRPNHYLQAVEGMKVTRSNRMSTVELLGGATERPRNVGSRDCDNTAGSI